jgi:nitrile hydratase accessory protein
MIASMPLAEIRLALPGIPLDEEGPVFQAPWQAQAFAMTLALYEKGLFTWSEWAQSLSLTIRDAQSAGDPDTGENYYEHWLSALERIVTEKKLVDTAALSERKHAWEHAAMHTPHGQPIVLKK